MDLIIPKVIHYCWFGKNPLNDEAVRCIESWKKHFPDYQIIQWNESNFDFSKCDYAREAYNLKKWAFVSDYARFKILYEHGGIYFDTDVEVINNFDDLLEKGPFFGKESSPHPFKMINPGLGMAAFPKMKFYEEIVNYYEKIHYNIEQNITIVDHVTKLFQENGYKGDNEIEVISGFTLYPVEYFCPRDYLTGALFLTDNSRSIHLYSATWQTEKERKFMDFEHKLYKKVKLNSHNCFLVKIAMFLYCYGAINCTKKIIKKILKKIRGNI